MIADLLNWYLYCSSHNYIYLCSCSAWPALLSPSPPSTAPTPPKSSPKWPTNNWPLLSSSKKLSSKEFLSTVVSHNTPYTTANECVMLFRAASVRRKAKDLRECVNWSSGCTLIYLEWRCSWGWPTRQAGVSEKQDHLITTYLLPHPNS